MVWIRSRKNQQIVNKEVILGKLKDVRLVREIKVEDTKFWGKKKHLKGKEEGKLFYRKRIPLCVWNQ